MRRASATNLSWMHWRRGADCVQVSTPTSPPSSATPRWIFGGISTAGPRPGLGDSGQKARWAPSDGRPGLPDRASVAGLRPPPFPAAGRPPDDPAPPPALHAALRADTRPVPIRQGRPAKVPGGGPQSARAGGTIDVVMPSPPPLLSLCLPTYKRAPLLDGALRAVLDQIAPALTGQVEVIILGQRLARTTRRPSSRGRRRISAMSPCATSEGRRTLGRTPTSRMP